MSDYTPTTSKILDHAAARGRQDFIKSYVVVDEAHVLTHEALASIPPAARGGEQE